MGGSPKGLVCDMKQVIVTKDDDGIRPLGNPGQCLYCHRIVGEMHRDSCVTITKPVRVRAIVEYVVNDPQLWSVEQSAFRYNGSSWCGANVTDDINSYIDSVDDCGCDAVRVQVWDEKREVWVDYKNGDVDEGGV